MGQQQCRVQVEFAELERQANDHCHQTTRPEKTKDNMRTNKMSKFKSFLQIVPLRHDLTKKRIHFYFTE